MSRRNLLPSQPGSLKSTGLDDDDEDSNADDEDKRWSEVNEEVSVEQKKSAIEQEGGSKLDEIGEVGNVENEVLLVLYKDLTVNVADIKASIDVWVNNFFDTDVKTPGDVEGILKESGQRNFGGGGSLSWLSKNRPQLCQR